MLSYIINDKNNCGKYFHNQYFTGIANKTNINEISLNQSTASCITIPFLHLTLAFEQMLNLQSCDNVVIPEHDSFPYFGH